VLESRIVPFPSRGARVFKMRAGTGGGGGGRLLYGVDVEGYAEKRTEKRTD
jgi:hypothetical protein